MLRGIDRHDIFADDQDRGKFLNVLRAVVAPKDNDGNPLPPYCRIHAYCLMDNHVHLLIAEGSEVLKDKVLCSAIVDRLCHKSYLVNMTGTSYRIKETKKLNDNKQ